MSYAPRKESVILLSPLAAKGNSRKRNMAMMPKNL